MQKKWENKENCDSKLVDAMVCDVITSLNMIYQNNMHNYYFFRYYCAFGVSGGVSASFHSEQASNCIFGELGCVRACRAAPCRARECFLFFFFFSLPTGLGFAGQ